MRKILCVPLFLLGVVAVTPSFGWDGSMAMDADKRNVDLGQIINYNGFLYDDYPIDGQTISVTVIEKNTKEIILTGTSLPGTSAVEYFGNTAWPFTFEVDTATGFSAGKTYVVEAMYDDKSAKLEFFIQQAPEPTCLEKLGSDDVIVFTDRENYSTGDTIRISGCLSEKAFSKQINVSVYDPEGNKIGVSSIMPRSDRTYSENFVIDERFGMDGTYFAEVDAGGMYSSSKSFVVPEFGAIAVVMLVAVASVVALSRYAKVMPISMK
ncbi:MAG: hypothetical protein PVI88_00480 [Nitrosopumilaceae archaeon]